MFCEYKDVLGKPRQKFHSYRFYDVAILDVLGTILIAILISLIFKISFFWTLIVLFMLGVILHKLFCVETTVNKYLFGN